MENKFSCDVILDLIPLVKDNISSEDSKKLVLSHIEDCDVCREIYNSIENKEKTDDRKILKSIKKSLYLYALILLIFGGLVGIFLSNGMGMFYNFIIMPTIGGIGYFIIKKKRYLIPVCIFAFSYIWIFVYNLFDNILCEGWRSTVFTAPLFLSGIYAMLTILGIVIGWLLKFAFGKDESK